MREEKAEEKKGVGELKEEQVLPAIRNLVSLPISDSKTQSRSLFALYGLSFPTIFISSSLIPTYYILILLAIMITLSMHHHPLSRWEQPVAIC